MLSRTAYGLARSALERVPLAVWEHLAPKDVIGLSYHMVSDEHVAHIPGYGYRSCAEFEQDLRFAGQRYGFLDYAELQRLREGHADPGARRNRVLVTFDDGFEECFRVARPILLRLGVPCMFFVVANLIDNRTMVYESAVALCLERLGNLGPTQAATHAAALGVSSEADPVQAIADFAERLGPDDGAALAQLCRRLDLDCGAYLESRKPYLTSTQIRTLVADGFTIGAHGLAHRRLGGLPEEEIEREIVAACAFVADLTGRSPVPFAFPWNGLDIDRRLLADIRRRHPVVGLFFDTGRLDTDQPQVVQRIGVEAGGGAALAAVLREAWSRRAAWRR